MVSILVQRVKTLHNPLDCLQQPSPKSDTHSFVWVALAARVETQNSAFSNSRRKYALSSLSLSRAAPPSLPDPAGGGIHPSQIRRLRARRNPDPAARASKSSDPAAAARSPRARLAPPAAPRSPRTRLAPPTTPCPLPAGPPRRAGRTPPRSRLEAPAVDPPRSVAGPPRRCRPRQRTASWGERRRILAYRLAEHAKWALSLRSLLERDFDTQNTLRALFCVWVALCLGRWRQPYVLR